MQPLRGPLGARKSNDFALARRADRIGHGLWLCSKVPVVAIRRGRPVRRSIPHDHGGK